VVYSVTLANQGGGLHRTYLVPTGRPDNALSAAMAAWAKAQAEPPHVTQMTELRVDVLNLFGERVRYGEAE